MTTYNTGNPIGSTDPRDLYDNAENTDVWVNSLEREYWDDRLGRMRKTIYGMEAEFNADQSYRESEFKADQSNRAGRFNTDQSLRESQFDAFLLASGYDEVGDYAAGMVLERRNQVFAYNGQLYRAGAGLVLPFTSTGVWADESGFFVVVGDESLRQTLASDAGYRLVANQMAPNAYGIPGPLTDVVEQNVTISPVGYFDNKLWGRDGSNRLHGSDDMGVTWSLVSSPMNRNANKLLGCSDGEVLALNTSGISKSSGWADNPAAATWTTVLSKPSGNVADFLKWGFDGDGQKFIATHYSSTRSDSRYVWISTDAGSTWDIVWDSNTVDPTNNSHLHAACYDPWAGRFYFTEGHSTLSGIYYSDDDGANWTKAKDDIDGVQREPEFTTMTATDFGIVCGTDAHPNGVWLIRRTDDPDDLPIEYMGAWTKEMSGVIGFARDSFRDPDTGIVYVGFGNAGGAYSGIPNVIYAVGSSGANIIYSGLSGVYFSVIAAKGVIWAQEGVSTKWIRGNTSKFGGSPTDPVRALDRGNLGLGEGEYTRNDSLRIGLGSTANDLEVTVVGRSASSGSQRQTVIGQHAYGGAGQRTTVVGHSATGSTDSVSIGSNSSSSPYGTAVGYEAETFSSYGVSLGHKAKTNQGVAIGDAASDGGDSSGSSVAIGRGAVGGKGGIAIGRRAETSSPVTTGTVALGQDSKVEANYGIAIGQDALSSHLGAIALGRQSKTQRTNSLCIGNRHFESTATGGAIYLRSGDNSVWRITVSNTGELNVAPA